MTENRNALRNEYEDRIRTAIVSQVAIYDELEKLRDDYARVRRERDLLRQRCEHTEADLALVKAERDHYMVQVATFLEQFNNVSATLCFAVDQIREAGERAVKAPFKERGQAIEKLNGSTRE